MELQQPPTAAPELPRTGGTCSSMALGSNLALHQADVLLGSHGDLRVDVVS